MQKKLPEMKVSILDPFLTSCGSTIGICGAILEEEPDIVAMSCYLWNIERSLYIARILRKHGLRALMIAGGPDIHPDNVLLKEPDCPFDLFILGEGEQALYQVVSLVASEEVKFPKKAFVRSVPINPKDIPSPYLCGLINPPFRGNLLLESSRGCPNRCNYCYYHHNVPRITTFPNSRTAEELFWARNHEIGEITFVDPSFTSRPDLRKFLDLLATVNRDGFHDFYAELNAELCSEDLASILAQAGFKHVEVGLQSINPKALRAVGRPSRLEAFVKGVKALRSNSIEVMVDLIVGLPEDKKEDLFRAIDFCVSQDLFDELSLYPLSLLPGTDLRKKAGEMGIVYNPLPPYYVTETPWMSREDIISVFHYAEEATNIDYFPPEFPRMEHLEEPNLSIVWTLKMEDDPESWCRSVLENSSWGQAVTFKIEREDWWTYREPLGKFIQDLINRDPFLLISWVISEKAVFAIPDEIRLKVFDLFFCQRSHYKDREWFSTSSSFRSIQVFVQIFNEKTPGITLLWLTPELVHGLKNELWFLTTCKEHLFSEDLILSKARNLFGFPENSPYRITFV